MESVTSDIHIKTARNSTKKKSRTSIVNTTKVLYENKLHVFIIFFEDIKQLSFQSFWIPFFLISKSMSYQGF